MQRFEPRLLIALRYTAHGAYCFDHCATWACRLKYQVKQIYIDNNIWWLAVACIYVVAGNERFEVSP